MLRKLPLTGSCTALCALAGVALYLGCTMTTHAAEPGKSFRDCYMCPEMVVVPPGSFVMGSPVSEQDRRPHEGPQRTVHVEAAFAVSKYEVTRGQFAAFWNTVAQPRNIGCVVWDATTANFHRNPTALDWRRPGYPQGNDHPVVCVGWDEAKAYVAWLSQLTGHRYRLLSEAEWEYAARAGTDTASPWGNDPRQSCPYANLADETFVRDVPRGPGRQWYPGWHACRDGYAFTAPVGRLKPNRFGLHDMIGNAFEWVEDCWNESHSGALADARPRLTGDCTARVYRGGGWRTYSGRSAQRAGGRTRHASISFRVARDLTTPSQ